MDVIEQYRSSISYTDKQIIKLLNTRLTFCKLIGKEKQRLGLEVYDPNREEQNIKELSKLEKFPGEVEAIWPAIMAYSRELQKNN